MGADCPENTALKPVHWRTLPTNAHCLQRRVYKLQYYSSSLSFPLGVPGKKLPSLAFFHIFLRQESILHYFGYIVVEDWL
jgi:hypothetical protein